MTDNKTAQEWGELAEDAKKYIVRLEWDNRFELTRALDEYKNAIRMQLLAERGLINETNKEDGE